jgi:hypothetical protein
MQQSWLYGDVMQAHGLMVHRAWLVDARGPAGVAQFVCRRIAGYLSMALCSRGPLWRAGLAAEDRALGYRLMRRSLPARALRIPLFSPEQTDDQLAPGELAGMRRVMTGYSTVLLDLEKGDEALRAALDAKWRNRLTRAQSHPGLQIFVNANRGRCEWLLAREREQRNRRRFFGLPTGFVEQWMDRSPRATPAIALGRADLAGETVAAMLFLVHGRTATYHIGWANEVGRECNAHNRILWESIGHLRTLGVARLDLGGVNTHSLPGISRFKLGTGGEVLRLAGTWH